MDPITVDRGRGSDASAPATQRSGKEERDAPRHHEGGRDAVALGGPPGRRTDPLPPAPPKAASSRPAAWGRRIGSASSARFRWPGGIRSTPRRSPRVRGQCEPVGHGPPVPAPRGHRTRRSGTTDARGVHHPRVPSPRDRAHRAWADGRERGAPDAGAAGQGRHDAGRARRRPIDLLRGRGRMVQAESRPGWACRGRRARSASSSSRRRCGSHGRCRRATGPRSRPPSSTRRAHNGRCRCAPADHGRRWRRTVDARGSRPST